MWIMLRLLYVSFIDFVSLLVYRYNYFSCSLPYFVRKICDFTLKPSCRHSHKNGKTVWKHGPYSAFRSIMLHLHGWSLSKGIQNNKNDFRQGQFLLRGWPRCCLSNNWCRYVWYDRDMESEIVTCIKNLPSRENCLFKCQFCPKVCLSKRGLSRHFKAKHQQHTTLYIVKH